MLSGQPDEAQAKFRSSFQLHQGTENSIGMAISQNNQAVIHLKRGEIEAAQKVARSAVILIEPMVFQRMKEEKHDQAKTQDTESVKEFMEILQILLIAYHNMGMVSYKQGSLKYSTKVFDQGW